MRIATVVACLALPMAPAEEPRALIAIRAVHPDRQVREVIGLFEGSKAPHPAAALTAWKRASLEPNRLGKPLEALIASFNPAMADELRSLDNAEVALRFDPAGGRLGWGVSIPEDDGTFGALATTFVLSGGQSEPVPDDPAVDRLGGPGSPLMTRGPRGPLIAGTLDDLRVVRQRARREAPGGRPDGFHLEVEPGALEGSRSIAVRQVAEAVRTLHGSILGHLRLTGDTYLATFEAGLPRPIEEPSLDPSWLDWIPSSRVAGGFAMTLGSGATTRDAAFDLADRVERVDPARARLAPSRIRLGLLARSVGVRLESDLLPYLRGLSGWVGEDPRAGLVALHLADEAAAGRLADRVQLGPALDSVVVSRRGKSVAIAWGEGSLTASDQALKDSGKSSGPALRSGWSGRPPAIAGGLWPGRIPGVLPEPSPLKDALREAPPVTLTGSWADPIHFRVLARWDGLHALVSRFLDRIPMIGPANP